MLKHNKYFVESSHPEALRLLLEDRVIQDARLATAQVNNSPEAVTLTTKETKMTDDDKIAVAVPSDADLFISVVGVGGGLTITLMLAIS